MSDQSPRFKGLEEVVANLREKYDRRLDEVTNEVERVADENRELRREVQQLRADIEDLRQRTDLLAVIDDASALSKDERAGVCLQQLVRECHRKRDAGNEPVSSMTARRAYEEVLCINRQLAYDALKRAPELVGDTDVCCWEKEPRGHEPPSRLVLDLTQGGLPDAVAGVHLRGGDAR